MGSSFVALALLGLFPIVLGEWPNTSPAPLPWTTTEQTGKSSISGMWVTCHTSLENCLEACYMSCYITDLCNDQPDMAACAPGLPHYCLVMDDPTFDKVTDKIFLSGIDCLLQRMGTARKIYEWSTDNQDLCTGVDWTMVILTLLFVVFLTTCCGVLCFFAPCCCCAIMYKGYRARRAGRRPRNETDNIAYPSAPPLLAKV